MAAVDFRIKNQFPYAGGQRFGAVGTYQQLDGEIEFAVDPLASANAGIVDLKLAPKDADGAVHFVADLSIVCPADVTRASGTLLMELPNRGRRRAVDMFNQTGVDASASPPPGDAFLFERGMTVASVGWQWDVYRSDVLLGLSAPLADIGTDPKPGQTVVEIRPYQNSSTWLLADRTHQPLRANAPDQDAAALYVRTFEDGPLNVVPRQSWRFAKQTSNGIEASDEHVYLEGGFTAGLYYQLVYDTLDAPVVGAGLLALRDAGSWFKHASLSQFGIPPATHALAYGVSQTGRMLRHFLYLGLNLDEQHRCVFDGMLPHIAGARRGAFNHRFAQPSNQSYPSFGHLFPFADQDLIDPFSSSHDGLMARQRALGGCPKVIYTNSSSEYWRGDGSLAHTDPLALRDLAEQADSRVYHFAGTKHTTGSIPQQSALGPEGAKALWPTCVVDYVPLLRAALIHLERWVREGIEPPASVHPRIDDGTAVPRAEVIASFQRLQEQSVPAADKLWVIRTIDLGPDAPRGVGVYPPPEGEVYPCLAAAVDKDGNEIAGIRLPDLTQPVATHTGWNLRDPSTGAPDQLVAMQGFSKWFSVTRAARERAGDPRLSIEERYADRADYVARVGRDAEALVAAGYVLSQDHDLVVDNAVARYDYLLENKARENKVLETDAPQKAR